AAHERGPPPQQPERGREQDDRRGDRRRADAADRGGELEAQQQRDHAGGDHRGGRERVENVFDRERGDGRPERHAPPHERGLGGLANERPERRGIADRVAADHRGDSVAERERVRRVETQPPRGRAQQEPQSSDRDHQEQAPSDLPHVGRDLRNADAPRDEDEQREPRERGENAGDADSGHGPGTIIAYFMLPASLQIPAAIILLIGGLISCFAGYRVFRVVLGIYGFILGALFASGAMGTEHTIWMIGAALAGGLAGALILVAADFGGVALLGAGVGGLGGGGVWGWFGGEPAGPGGVLFSIGGA